MSPSVYFEDLEVGSEMWGPIVSADEAEMVDYARRFDPWPMHVDRDATDNPYEGLIASGGYTIGLWYLSGHGIWNRPNHQWAFLGGFDWRVRFIEPVRAGDDLRLWVQITEARRSRTSGRGIISAKTELQRPPTGAPVLEIDAVVMVATRPN